MELGRPEGREWLGMVIWELKPEVQELFEDIWEMVEWKEGLTVMLRASEGKKSMTDYLQQLKYLEFLWEEKKVKYEEAAKWAQAMFDRKRQLYGGEENWVYLVRAAGHPLFNLVEEGSDDE